MIAVFITIFVAVLVGVSLIGPISDQVNTAAISQNASGSTCTSTSQGGCSGAGLYITSSWGATVLKLVPGFFSLIILGTVVAGLYTVFRQAGIV